MSEETRTMSEVEAIARMMKLDAEYGLSDPVDPSEYEFYEVEPGLWRNLAGDEYDYRNMDPCQCEGPNETYPRGFTCALHGGTSR